MALIGGGRDPPPDALGFGWQTTKLRASEGNLWRRNAVAWYVNFLQLSNEDI